MFDSEITVAVLDDTEKLLGYLNPKHVQISEVNELYKLRTLTIVCQLVDENNTDLSKYDTMLRSGYKIWKQSTTDGDSCLYVLKGDKVYGDDFTSVTVMAVEVAVELGEYKILRDSGFEWTVDSTFINNTFGELFDAGTIDGPTEQVDYSGALTPLAIINEIQDKTGGEFQYRYEYDPALDMIKRYIDFHEQVGVTHPDVIELGYNAKIISLKTNEDEVYSAAGPEGEPSSASDEFHQNRKAFEDLEVVKGSSIPLYYTKDDSGNLIPGNNAYAPYAKPAGQNYVECDEPSELIAAYQRIQHKAGSSGSSPRLKTFTSSETHPINLYWECVNTIRNHLQPAVELGIELVNLLKLEGTDEYYNIGDVVNIRLPGRDDVVTCRITKTTKDPRNPTGEQLEISTYRTTFMQDFFQKYFKSSGAIQLN